MTELTDTLFPGLHPAAALSRRPPRRMPSLWAIVSYWEARGGHPLRLGGDSDGTPFCFACGAEPRFKVSGTPRERWNGAAGYLERAHLVDRARSGLDGPQNLVPLCGLCHSIMPMFRVEQADEAVWWVVLGGRLAPPRLVREAAYPGLEAGTGVRAMCGQVAWSGPAGPPGALF